MSDHLGIPIGYRSVVGQALRRLGEQLPSIPGPLLPAMAVREWLDHHADRLIYVHPAMEGPIEPPTAALDPAQLDGLRNSLVLAFQDSEVIRLHDMDGNPTDDWDGTAMDEAQRMADVAMVAITATVAQ